MSFAEIIVRIDLGKPNEVVFVEINIGEKIKSLRLRNNLTQKELADRCELSKGFISQLESNQTSPSLSTLEGVSARGDRRLSRVLLAAHRMGAKFDSWQECFDYDLWMRAFSESGLDPAFYNTRKRSFDEILPWDHIDVGVTKAFLQRECEKAYRGETTRTCREQCAGCGIQGAFGGGFCG